MTDNRVREFSFSSEAPVDRWFGKEILDHSGKSARMDFIKSGRAPLLLGHGDTVLGVVTKAAIGKDKVGRGAARFARTTAAADAMMNVDDAIMMNTSVGYRIHGMTLDRSDETGDTYRVDDWEPLEVSLVGIPADQSVGFGRMLEERASDLQVTEIRETLPTPSQLKDEQRTQAMEAPVTVTPPQAVAPEVDRMNPAERDRSRRQAIAYYCQANKIDARTESKWCQEGTSLEEVGRAILEIVQERGKHAPTAASTLGLSPSETRGYSLFRAIRAMRYGGQDRRYTEEAAFELECSRAVAEKLGRQLTTSILIPGEILERPIGKTAAQRALDITPGGKGGYLVQVENMGFIDILRNRSVTLGMGATSLPGLVGNPVFPRQTGKPSVTWQAGGGTSITAADQTFGQLSMTPKTAIVITDVSEQLLAQSSPAVEGLVMADLAADIAIDGVDSAAINGTGGAQPLGIKNTTGITSGQDSSTMSYAKALAFPVAAGSVNAIRGNPGWVTNIAGAAICMQRQRFTSTDTPIWQGNLLSGELVGFNAMSSEQLASGNLIFGSWAELLIGSWGVLELAMDNGGTRFNQAQVGIRAMWMVDVLLRYPQAFVVSTNLS